MIYHSNNNRNYQKMINLEDIISLIKCIPKKNKNLKKQKEVKEKKWNLYEKKERNSSSYNNHKNNRKMMIKI